MDIIEMTRSLGHAIQQEESFKKLMKAQNACDNDPVLQDMIGEFNLKRMNLSNASNGENVDQEKISRLNIELRDCYDDIMENANMVAYNEAKDEFDAVMNYPLGESIRDFWIDKSLSNEDFEYTINRCYTTYMQQTNDVLFNLLDSHDTKRLRNLVKSLDEYFAQLAVLFTMPGSPCIYYGTEIAMEGDFDPDNRRCMPWDEIEAGKFASRIEIISKLIHLRKQEPLLRSRNFHFPENDNQNPRLIHFQKMGWVDNGIEVFINCSDEDVEIAPAGELLLARHYVDNALLCNGFLIRRMTKE